MLSRSLVVASQWYDGTGWRTGLDWTFEQERRQHVSRATFEQLQNGECSQLDRCGGCLIMRAPFSTTCNPVMFVGGVNGTMTSDHRAPFLKPLPFVQTNNAHPTVSTYRWIDLSSSWTVNDPARMSTVNTKASLVVEDGQIVQDHPTAGLHHQKDHDHHYPVSGGCQSRISLISKYGAVPTHYRRSPQPSVVNWLEIASPDHP